MKAHWITTTLTALGLAGLQAAAPVYFNDFEKEETGSVPQGFLVIDGNFAVRADGDNKVFELPGAPLESFGFLFGPAFAFNEAGTRFRTGTGAAAVEYSRLSIAARARSERKGRRYPTYSVGLCGVAGYKLRVAPMKRALELVRGDDAVATIPHDWESGAWLRMKLEIVAADGTWTASGKVWKDGETEPAGWLLTYQTKDRPNPGPSSGWASPFSGEPVRFDDLRIEAGE